LFKHYSLFEYKENLKKNGFCWPYINSFGLPPPPSAFLSNPNLRNYYVKERTSDLNKASHLENWYDIDSLQYRKKKYKEMLPFFPSSTRWHIPQRVLNKYLFFIFCFSL
jgi:hypothetical protein